MACSKSNTASRGGDGHQNINGLVKFGLFKNLELRFANNPHPATMTILVAPTYAVSPRLVLDTGVLAAYGHLLRSTWFLGVTYSLADPLPETLTLARPSTFLDRELPRASLENR